jgi:hypothetical protein
MEHFTRSLDRFQQELEALQRSRHDLTAENAEAVREACWRHAEEQLGHTAGHDFSRTYKSHPVSGLVAKSAFIRSALEKKYGYAGDKDLMEMIYDNQWVGEDDFTRMLNAVYLNLPAAEAVRQRMKTIARVLNALPSGSRVLNVACGSARELSHVSNDIEVDLSDHDPHALAHVARYRSGVAADLIRLNAFEFIKGKRTFDRHDGGPPVDLGERTYDLIYSNGLYDYIPAYPDNPARGAPALTAGLFERLKPGGRLIIGNYADQGPNNPHLRSHRFMMELYSEWTLIYRSREQMLDFARTLPANTSRLDLYNERFEDPESNPTVLWFLVVTKVA